MRISRRLGGLLILSGLVAAVSCERARAPAPPATTSRSGTSEAKDESREAPPDTRPVPNQAASSGVGTLSGRVIFRGSLPTSTTQYVAEAGELEAHTIIADARTRGLKNAVVWVEDGPPGTPAADLPAAVLDQENWTFVPHVLAVRAGQKVRFLNSDVANHNVHSLTAGSTFNLGFPSGAEATYRFRKPTGTRPVRLGCDIHDWMRAWVYVFRQDAFAVTDAEGRFRIEGVPAGRPRLRVHHADGELEATREVVVERDDETRVDVEIGG